MYNRTLLTTCVLALSLQANSTAADEAADNMVREALPLMYHTCASVVEASDGDEAFIVDVVRKMTALTLINRKVDLAEHTGTDEQKTKVRADFIEALRTGCENDKDALLGGVVDNAVKSTLGL